ncbi:MAG: inner membrane CreD family protein [Chitinophagaceae bacterium]|nr:inner membrane CreD family protein [Chitinophagaceae bacterium]
MIKSFFIGFLVLALLIPTFLIIYLVNERKERKQEVTREISNKWSAAQTITGPFLIIPYHETENNVLLKKTCTSCLNCLTSTAILNRKYGTAVFIKYPCTRPGPLHSKENSRSIHSIL